MLPTFKDISPTSGLDLDERCALEHFHGLDQSQALSTFRRDPDMIHVFLDDFVHMGIRAFEYYVPSISQYIDGLRDKEFIEEAPEIADYLLIRFSSDDNISKEMSNLIGKIHERIQKVPTDYMLRLPARIADALKKYKESDQVGAGDAEGAV